MQDIGNAVYLDMARNTAARVDNPASTTTLITWTNAIPGGERLSAADVACAASYGHETRVPGSTC